MAPKTNRERGWDLRTRVAVKRELDAMAKRLWSQADRRRPAFPEQSAVLEEAARMLVERGEELTK